MWRICLVHDGEWSVVVEQDCQGLRSCDAQLELFLTNKRVFFFFCLPPPIPHLLCRPPLRFVRHGNEQSEGHRLRLAGCNGGQGGPSQGLHGGGDGAEDAGPPAD